MVERALVLRQLELLSSLNEHVIRGPLVFCGMGNFKVMVRHAQEMVAGNRIEAIPLLARIAGQLQLLVSREQSFLLYSLYVVWDASLRGIRV